MKIQNIEDKISKTGKKYRNLTVLTSEGKEVTGSCWDEGEFKVGEELDFEITYNGNFTNLKLANGVNTKPKTALNESNLEERVSKLENWIRKEFEAKFAQFKSDLTLQATGAFQTDKDYQKMNVDYPPVVKKEEEVSPDDIPF